MADGSAPTSSDNVPYDKKGERRFEPIREIRVRGAREHNLKAVDVDIPRDRLVVVTGLSGSGKSSLAFDTIFAEGQRKYMESLSAYARQFLDQQKKPDVESIEGLPPTIAIEQRSAGHNPRSTVATSTEIYDYLRLLFARAGRPHCWAPIKKKKRDGTVVERCGMPIARAHPSQITDAVSTFPEGTKLMILAPVVKAKKGFHRDVLEQLSKDGYVRARVNGSVIDIGSVLDDEGENPMGLGRYEKHTIEAVVDRLVVRDKSRARLADSVETALKIAEGIVVVASETDDGWKETVYSEHYACPKHPSFALDELEPRLFSFNSPQGACSRCQGLGILLEYDEELILPDLDAKIGKDGVKPWKKAGPAGMFSGRLKRRFCKRFDVKQSTTIGALGDELRQILLHGVTEEQQERFGAEWGGGDSPPRGLVREDRLQVGQRVSPGLHGRAGVPPVPGQPPQHAGALGAPGDGQPPP